jgi:DNA-binding cell septation regulator SpoVG
LAPNQENPGSRPQAAFRVFSFSGVFMNKEKITVEVNVYENKSMKAWADVALVTDLGEVTIKGLKIIQKDTTKPPWVALPTLSYLKDGQYKNKVVLELSSALMKAVAEAVLNEYRRITAG